MVACRGRGRVQRRRPDRDRRARARDRRDAGPLQRALLLPALRPRSLLPVQLRLRLLGRGDHPPERPRLEPPALRRFLQQDRGARVGRAPAGTPPDLAPQRPPARRDRRGRVQPHRPSPRPAQVERLPAAHALAETGMTSTPARPRRAARLADVADAAARRRSSRASSTATRRSLSGRRRESGSSSRPGSSTTVRTHSGGG